MSSRSSAASPWGCARPGTAPTDAERTRLIALVVRHEAIVADLFRSSPVLPVRFGTVFRTEDAVRGFLTASADPVRQFLDATRGREEWVLKGFLRTDRARRSVIAADPELAARFNRLSAAPGARYLQEKQLFAEADRRSGCWALATGERVTARLAGSDTPVRPLRPAAAPDPEFGGGPVYQAAFLVARGGRAGWLQRLDTTAGEFEPQGLTLVGTGPWPPAAFAPDLSAELGP
ncbi:GvpL/GvpF family gas vesicle protein [Frigoriglobus tundricola]|uniref:Uncharacterized protein n=1 Tax=Frigoriglobus tundricola TaxID=2774151 RepID=A0A6M5Z6N9_9BACT|nr:GvpL/GvpF family gas vesicle protein [Frigoriglobus tundricola]QJX01272.1 hypothetical protein FTUN_8914 [Frigoriglobus tundricola]